ncbi:glycosyltransferase [Vibrio fluvialis]|uniref:glycosyltransferase n=1 Tax=Vibrio fluvialis TaxID=676 RepID=UPI0006E3E902|nr:glycosyltransferase [Vibrio fluvialis]KQH88779.1 glycosyl transferase family 2 [Vibrio fluvialis]MBY8113348.1 glycosyltransferase [Vibrio fluvialis]MBY8296485.1 glycosyltransferase [Vibrio fluvialis]MBY8313319.1 glycosyltransferase [Vibrio fluvialis]MCE7642508.1 glycosyltransferase [Vibrio fluvialis]
MKHNLSVLKFAFSRFLFLIRERGFKYALERALSKRKQLLSMLRLMPRKKNPPRQSYLHSTTEVTFEEGLVSVIIPVYDRTWELKAAIESILNQSYSNLELILVCDGSPEETIEVIEEYRLHPKVKIFKYPTSSGNAVRGRNKGLLESSGEFIAFLDSDDVADVDRLKNSVTFLNDNSDYAGVYGTWKAIIDGSREVAGLTDGMVVHSPDGELEEHLANCIPCQSTVMVRKSALVSVGGINVNMKYREDHELWARLNFYGYRLKSLDTVLVNLRLHAGNNELNFSGEDGRDEWRIQLLKEYNTKVVLRKKICWVVAGLGISGGLAVILKHANHLLSQGHDVSLITLSDETEVSWTRNAVPVYSIKDEYALNNIDLLIATAWNTESTLEEIDASRYLYFVQSDERRFINQNGMAKSIGEGYNKEYEYFTEAFWIQEMFHNEFGRPAFYVPNGIDGNMFKPTEPYLPKGNRKRVLIEGPIDIPFKAVEDCYNAVKDLDCEIWIISSAGKPKDGWRYDQFFEKVPQKMMPVLYSSCDIFIKMSRIEGFFGPPLEAMACNCVPVVGKVTGWDEYIVNEYNALAVELADVEGAKNAVSRLLCDNELYAQLQSNGRQTVSEWPWENSFERLDRLINRF